MQAHVELLAEELDKISSNVEQCKKKLFTDSYMHMLKLYGKSLYQNMYTHGILEGIYLALETTTNIASSIDFLQSCKEEFEKYVLQEKPYKEGTNALENLAYQWTVESQQHIVRILTKALNTAKAIQDETKENKTEAAEDTNGTVRES